MFYSCSFEIIVLEVIMEDKHYVMWNRQVNDSEVEVRFYSLDWIRVGKEIILKEDFHTLECIPVSPMEVYFNINGTMGV